jgi:hypothetical protein
MNLISCTFPGIWHRELVLSSRQTLGRALPPAIRRAGSRAPAARSRPIPPRASCARCARNSPASRIGSISPCELARRYTELGRSQGRSAFCRLRPGRFGKLVGATPNRLPRCSCCGRRCASARTISTPRCWTWPRSSSAIRATAGAPDARDDPAGAGQFDCCRCRMRGAAPPGTRTRLGCVRLRAGQRQRPTARELRRARRPARQAARSRTRGTRLGACRCSPRWRRAPASTMLPRHIFAKRWRSTGSDHYLLTAYADWLLDQRPPGAGRETPRRAAAHRRPAAALCAGAQGAELARTRCPASSSCAHALPPAVAWRPRPSA